MHGSSTTDIGFGCGRRPKLSTAATQARKIRRKLKSSTASANNTRPVSQPTTSTFHSLVILHPFYPLRRHLDFSHPSHPSQ